MICNLALIGLVLAILVSRSGPYSIGRACGRGTSYRVTVTECLECDEHFCGSAPRNASLLTSERGSALCRSAGVAANIRRGAYARGG